MSSRLWALKEGKANDRQLRNYCGDHHECDFETIRVYYPRSNKYEEFEFYQKHLLRKFVLDGGAENRKIKIYRAGRKTPLNGVIEYKDNIILLKSENDYIFLHHQSRFADAV